MNHFQDWQTIILKKPIEIKSSTNSYKGNKTNKERLLENSEDIIKPKKIDLNLKKSIQTARVNKKLSQKQLASSLGVPLQTIIQYENGKAIPNNNFITKIEKILNVKLPRVKN